MQRELQKQSLADVLQDRCFKKLIKFHRKTPVSESLFNKYSGLEACNFIKNRLQHWCFPSKFRKFLEHLFFTEYLRWLLFELDKSDYVEIIPMDLFKAQNCLPHDLLFSKFEAYYVNEKWLSLILNYFTNSSVIRQKGESQNE